MALSLSGFPQLRRRLEAVKKSPRPLLQRIQLDAVAEAKKNTIPFRKTGNLGRTIRAGSLTNAFAIVEARANYAAFVELGTRPHEIRPRNAKVLAWPASPAGRRLSGSARRGADMAFARVVHHPGTKPEPFLVPGARSALRKNGIAEPVIHAWNDAA